MNKIINKCDIYEVFCICHPYKNKTKYTSCESDTKNKLKLLGYNILGSVKSRMDGFIKKEFIKFKHNIKCAHGDTMWGEISINQYPNYQSPCGLILVSKKTKIIPNFPLLTICETLSSENKQKEKQKKKQKLVSTKSSKTKGIFTQVREIVQKEHDEQRILDKNLMRNKLMVEIMNINTVNDIQVNLHDPTETDIYGMNSYHYCAKYGTLELFAKLMNHIKFRPSFNGSYNPHNDKARHQAKLLSGALDIALENKNFDIAKKIKSHGDSWNANQQEEIF